jgi:uncharacterized coiled-coil DUF342 family protein
MRDTEAEEIDDLRTERRIAVATIDDAQRDLDRFDREIAERKAAIAEYQELIKRLEAI